MQEHAQRGLVYTCCCPRGQHVGRKEMEAGKGGLEKRGPTLFIRTHVGGNIFLAKLIHNTQQQHPVPSQAWHGFIVAPLMNLPLVGAHFYSVHSKLAQEKLLHKTWKRVNKSHICHEDCNNCQSHKHFQAESGGFNTDSLSWAPAAPHSTLPHRDRDRDRDRAASPASQPASEVPTTLRFLRKRKICGGNLWPKLLKY